MKALQVVGSTVTLLAVLVSAAMGEYNPPVTGTPTNDGGTGGRTSEGLILAQAQECTVNEDLTLDCKDVSTEDEGPFREGKRSDGQDVPAGS